MAHAHSDADWLAIELACRAGGESVRGLARRFGVSEATVRRRARAGGWLNAAPPVALPAAGAGANPESDIACGLRIHRACLRALESAATAASDPRDIKLIIDATRIAVSSLQALAGADDPSPDPLDDDDDGFALALASRLEATRSPPTSP